MGQLQFKKLTTEKDELIHFLCANPWPFHAETKQNPDDVKRAFEQDGKKVGLQTPERESPFLQVWDESEDRYGAPQKRLIFVVL